ncbi:MAG: DEAD/DEAH box helicase, partial [Aestuariibacter sp.]|nr:DEAD/DEAH box helicase [Aestuariibacter sp.]
MRPMIARVALPVPLDKQFDYKIPSHLFPIIGGRVSVPFGRQTLTGIVTALVNESEFELDKLKPIKALLDNQPVWPDSVYSLLTWCSQFYQYPLGETFANALPSALRKGKAADFATLVEWQLTPSGRDQLMQGFGRAVKQAKVIHMLEHGAVPHQEFIDQEIGSAILKTLEEKGWIESVEKKPKRQPWPADLENDQDKPKLNGEQAIAIATVNSQNSFGCFLLEGVTGSGKTEVYLNMIKPILDQGKQALVLVPEIGLTPQTINRFKRRFNVPVEVIHSGLNDSERLNAWLSARDKIAGIVIGTRSALFTPFADLGIIIVDEEHDASYKQQDSLRYHARDVAIMRAHKAQIPV